MVNLEKNLKTILASKKLTIGSWLTIGDESIAEIMAMVGFDWVTIDMEHSAITLDSTQQLIRIIELSGITPLVRVGENDANLIKRVMDAGACGVIVPMVNTLKEAVRAVKAVKYPPFGTRGVGLARAQGYGFNFEGYKTWVNQNSVVIVQIEHIEAINNLEDILGIEGVDATIIGPYDLSASLGYPGDFQRKEVEEALQKYEILCDKLNKPKGIHVVSTSYEDVLMYVKKGYKFIAFGTDFLFLGFESKKALDKLKAAVEDRN